MSDPAQSEEAVFTAALKLAAGQRDAYLQEVCGGDTQLRARVEGLLQSVGQPVGTDKTMMVSVPLTEKPGDKIGRYKLLQQIGEGGCGVVYMADQEEPVKRRVALKVIKPGMDTKEVLGRFEAERQALALMDHPNISKVLDAGATETGRPFFVMELVRGVPITRYCDEHKLNTEQRLELFIQVCQAIQHAHQKGIIHRDIKPSNILVADHDGVPVPKIIDFGIAKATAGQPLTDKTVFTALEQFIGTPAYMSPEQANLSGLDVDTRSDIYSLGVLLYELLTGKTPFDARRLIEVGFDEIRRIIRDEEPQRPSRKLSTLAAEEQTTTANSRQTDSPRLIHLVRGDLDWIVMKCLEKDRNRRYETANGLASDILRHVNNEPVLARPPSQVYRFQKMVGRNKLAFAAGAAVALALIVGLGISTWMFLQAKANERKAQAEAAKSRQVAQFLKDMLNGVGPSVALGRDTTLLKEVLSNTANRVGADLAKQPEVEAELRYTLGEVYWELGDLANAEAMHRAALTLRSNALGNKDPQVAQSMRRLSHVLWRRGRMDEAENMARAGVAMQRELFGSKNLEVAGSLRDLSAILNTKNNVAEAIFVLRESLAIQEAILGHDSLEVADTLGDLAGVLSRNSKETAEAGNLSRKALEINKKILGPDNPLVRIDSLRLQATELENQGKLGEAETALNERLAAQRKVFGNEHPSLAQALNRLATVLKKEGKLAESESIRREALAMQRKLLGDENEEVSQTVADLGSVLASENKLSEAESTFRETMILRRKVFGSDSSQAAITLARLGGILEKEGKLEDARRLYLDAADGTNASATTAQYRLGLLYQHGTGVPRDLAEAAKWFRKSAELGYAAAQYTLAGFYQYAEGVKKDSAEAIKWYRKAAAQGGSGAQNDLGWMYQNRWGVKRDYAEAVKLYRESAEQNNPWGESNLAWCYETGLGVEKDLLEAVKWWRKAAGQRFADGQSSLGWCCENGLGVEKDLAAAVEWYRQAAAQGKADPQLQLGRMYEFGLGVARDYGQSLKWYRKSAEQGNTTAQFRLAWMHQHGEGAPRDDTQSVKYIAAIEKRDAQALNDLGWTLATSETAGMRDGTNAVHFAEKAVAATQRTNAGFLGTLAAAYAETHQFEKAVTVQQEAMALLDDERDKKDYAARLKLYQSNTPCRERTTP